MDIYLWNTYETVALCCKVGAESEFSSQYLNLCKTKITFLLCPRGTVKLSSGFSLKRPTSISFIEPYDPLFIEYPHILSPNHALGARIRYPVLANGFGDVLKSIHS